MEQEINTRSLRNVDVDECRLFPLFSVFPIVRNGLESYGTDEIPTLSNFDSLASWPCRNKALTTSRVFELADVKLRIRKCG